MGIPNRTCKNLLACCLTYLIANKVSKNVTMANYCRFNQLYFKSCAKSAKHEKLNLKLRPMSNSLEIMNRISFLTIHSQLMSLCILKVYFVFVLHKTSTFCYRVVRHPNFPWPEELLKDGDVYAVRTTFPSKKTTE